MASRARYGPDVALERLWQADGGHNVSVRLAMLRRLDSPDEADIAVARRVCATITEKVEALDQAGDRKGKRAKGKVPEHSRRRSA